MADWRTLATCYNTSYTETLSSGLYTTDQYCMLCCFHIVPAPLTLEDSPTRVPGEYVIVLKEDMDIDGNKTFLSLIIM